MHTGFSKSLALVLAGLLYAGTETHAGYLGTVGPVYQIEEEDMLSVIARKLKEKEADGTIARLQEEMRTGVERKLVTPAPAEGVVLTTTPRSYYFDPSTTLPQAVTTPEGRVLAAAGTRINPLDYRNWSGRLLFIDGRDAASQAYATRVIAQAEGRVKPVLVAGDLRPLSRGWRMPVYYDQGGELVRRFGITQVPAHVYQEGKRIRIDEVLPR